MKKQNIAKYHKRLIVTNIFYYILVNYPKHEHSFDSLVEYYCNIHFPEYPVRWLADITFAWAINTFRVTRQLYHIFYLDPEVVLDVCKEYNISLEDITKFSDYVE